MIAFENLHHGLCGMANAPKASSMAGHLGAAVVAGYFFGEDHPDLEPGVAAAIERDLDRIMGGEESIWFDPKKAGITAKELFKPFPERADPQAGKKAAERIAAALATNIGELRQSGHNVIFASIAIRALVAHAEFGSQGLVDGVVKLIAAFDGQHGGRGYYGKKRGWKVGGKAPLSDDSPDYKSLGAMAETVIDQLIATGSEHRRGFGSLFHLINHAAALIELDRCGYRELAGSGLGSHRQHLRLYRALPNLEDELGKLERTADDPFDGKYWVRTESKQWGAWLTHRIKTLYGFHTLLPLVEDKAKRVKALEQFGFLLA